MKSLLYLRPMKTKNTYLSSTIKKGPKRFITTDTVLCWRDNEIVSGQYTLPKGLDYITTDCQYLSNGDLYFTLWDEQGYIGKYIIYKESLKNIKALGKSK